jgi:DNA replication protein DnaC
MRRSGFKALTPQHKELLDAAARFAGELNNSQPRWLTLTGPSGIGKTMLAREVWRHWMDYSRFDIGFDAQKQQVTGNTGQFVCWRRFCGDIRGGAFGRVDDICSEHFVVLDDIGSEYDPSGFIASTLDRIINARQGKWTLITCNLSLSQIAARLDARIADRMLRDGSEVVEGKVETYNAWV